MVNSWFKKKRKRFNERVEKPIKGIWTLDLSRKMTWGNYFSRNLIIYKLNLKASYIPITKKLHLE